MIDFYQYFHEELYSLHLDCYSLNPEMLSTHVCVGQQCIIIPPRHLHFHRDYQLLVAISGELHYRKLNLVLSISISYHASFKGIWVYRRSRWFNRFRNHPMKRYGLLANPSIKGWSIKRKKWNGTRMMFSSPLFLKFLHLLGLPKFYGECPLGFKHYLLLTPQCQCQQL